MMIIEIRVEQGYLSRIWVPGISDFCHGRANDGMISMREDFEAWPRETNLCKGSGRCALHDGDEIRLYIDMGTRMRNAACNRWEWKELGLICSWIVHSSRVP